MRDPLLGHTGARTHGGTIPLDPKKVGYIECGGHAAAIPTEAMLPPLVLGRRGMAPTMESGGMAAALNRVGIMPATEAGNFLSRIAGRWGLLGKQSPARSESPPYLKEIFIKHR